MADKAVQMMVAVPGMPEMVGEDGPAPAITRDLLGHAPLAQKVDTGRINLTWASLRVVVGNPSKVAGVTDATVHDTAASMLVSLIGSAKSDVVVVTPYFVPCEP